MYNEALIDYLCLGTAGRGVAPGLITTMIMVFQSGGPYTCRLCHKSSPLCVLINQILITTSLCSHCSTMSLLRTSLLT